jgi:hypothetical protein
MLKTLKALLGQNREEPPKKPTPGLVTKPASAGKDYRAASVTPGVKCCPAAKNITGKRYLLREGLRLPLVNCTKPADCTCKFKKVPDRRDDDRRIGVSETGRWFAGVEKRKRGRGRRSGKD